MRAKLLRRILGLGLVAALALTVAPVSASAQGSGSSQKVKIMTFNLTGSGLDFDDFDAAAKAAARAIKKAGGPDIQVLVCETTVDPSSGADCAREAVDEGVIAVVGAFTTHADQYIPILEEAGIPSIAPYAIGFAELTSDISFPIAGGVLSGTAGMGAILADETNVKTIDVSYLDVPGGAGQFAAQLVAYGVEPRGLPAPTETPEPPGGADLTPSVQATIDKDTDGVVLATVDPEFSKWLIAYRQAGGKAKLAANGAVINGDNLETLGPNLDGVYVSNNYKPASTKGDPAVKRMVKELKAVDPDMHIVDPIIGTWAGTHLIGQAIADLPNPDAASLIAALNTDRDWDLGVIPPINFTKPSPEIAANPLLSSTISRLFNIDVYYTRIKNGKIVSLGNEAHNPLAP